MPHDMAYPNRYVIDPSIAGTEDGKKARRPAPTARWIWKTRAKSWSSRFRPCCGPPAGARMILKTLETYNFDQNPNLITNVQMERLAAIGGPTGGKILRPGAGDEPKNVAFVQCAGSRDENHLPFCSTVCCLASLKQATYVREQYPEADVTIYFIDIRAMDRNEDFYSKVKADEKVKFVKSKIAKITPAEGGNMVLEGEDTEGGQKFEAEHDLVVLATGMQPNTALNKIPADVSYDEYGFVLPNPGIIGVGTVRRPSEVVILHPGRYGGGPQGHAGREVRIMADIKTACYICKGCGIGEALDIEALTSVIKKEGKIPEVKEHDALCSAEGLEMIKGRFGRRGQLYSARSLLLLGSRRTNSPSPVRSSWRDAPCASRWCGAPRAPTRARRKRAKTARCWPRTMRACTRSN